jgi:uncharacterized membrane protein
MVESVLLPIVLLASGLSAGVLVGTQLGGFPLLAALPPDRYVHAHAFFATRYDPFMPACFVVTVVCDVIMAVWTPGVAPRVLFALGALLTVTTMAISVAKNVPVNKWVQTLDPDRLPADFDRIDPRENWGLWNRVRSGTATAVFALNCASLGLLV